MTNKWLFTSESVTEGHPDKMADQISDAILDEIIKDDTNARVACETLVTTGFAIIAGEITTKVYADFPRIVREVIKDIGYNHSSMGFDWETCAVISSIDKQSPDISRGVDPGGAGDQGMMFGFACNETPVLMPAPIYYAHKITQTISECRKNGSISFLLPDGKAQVTVEYDTDNNVKRIDTIVVSTQHKPDVTKNELEHEVINKVIKKAIPSQLLDKDTKFFINPTGRFVIGGPQGDCGLTGRKIIVDTYGGYSRHGGGAFSGKDPTKVDRSAAYMCRHIAKNIVAANLCKRCEIQLAYAIGIAEPVSVNVNTFNSSQVPDKQLVEIIKNNFPLTPKGIIEYLDLLKPIYRKTTNYGHFGREIKEFTWENTNRVNDLK